MEESERPTKIRKIEQDDDTSAHTLHASSADVPHEAVNGRASADDAVRHENSVQKSHTISEPHSNMTSIPAGDSTREDGRDAPKQLSKTQQKKLKRQEEWEAGREERKIIRRQQKKEQRERKRVLREEQSSTNIPPSDEPGEPGEPDEPETNPILPLKKWNRRPPPIHLPITFLFDCSFNDLMKLGELISLGGQLTRCYSDNNHSRYQVQLAFSSFGGVLKDRFDNLLKGQHTRWKNCRFRSEPFPIVAEEAQSWMTTSPVIASALATPPPPTSSEETSSALEEAKTIYLTADSPNTLTRLKPNTTYIIGAVVDKNRHKGICYKRAMDESITTAKLPIGEFLKMSGRQVLATNHVCEVMLKWLDTGDWATALDAVIPKRKGGKVGVGGSGGEGDGEDEGDAGHNDDTGDRDGDAASNFEAEENVEIGPS